MKIHTMSPCTSDQPECILVPVPSPHTHYPYRSDTVGWSDFQFFAIFENDCWRLAIFLKVQFQKIGARMAKFFSSKNHIDLKIFCCCKYLSFTSKKNRHKENLGNIFYIFYFRPPKWAKTVFYLVKGKMIFWSFSIFLAFK